MTRSVILSSTVSSAGGVLRHVVDLATAYQAKGMSVTVETLERSSAAANLCRASGLKVAPLGSTTRADVWHLHLASTYDRTAARIQIARSRSHRGERIVITEHLPRSEASDPSLAARPARFGATASKTAFKKVQYRYANRVISVSRGSRSFLLNRYRLSESSVACVPNGVRPVLSGSRHHPPRGGVRCVAVGSLIVQKGFDLLVDATEFASVPWHVRVVGAGPHREALRAAASRAMSQNRNLQIEFLGWSDDVAGEMADADVLVLPSRWESAPYAVLDAMSAGLSVVAFAVDGVEDAIADHVTGRLVPRGDVRAFAKAVDEHADFDLASTRGEAARVRASQRFSLDEMVNRTLAVYESR